ncbi:MAG: phosphate ABC transporter permease PstA [Candidatus Dormibacteria bacterium]
MSLAEAPTSNRLLIQRAARRSLPRRRLWGYVVVGLCILATLAALSPLVAVLAYTVGRGVSAWSVDFFTQLPTPPGIPGGGIANALVGSLIIDGIAAAMAIPFGIAAGLFLAEQTSRFANGVRFVADVLAGVPSITLGLFAYALLVVTLGHFSAIAGSFALAILMLPVVMRTTEASIRAVSRDVWEAGAALGGRRAQVAFRMVIPAALGGIVTGCLLGIARAVGESAPLLFTAIGSQFFAFNPAQPMASMPLNIYQLGIQAYPQAQLTAWGTALALVVIVLLLNIGSRMLARHFTRHAR